MADDQDRRIRGLIVQAADGDRWFGPAEVAVDLRDLVGQQLPGGCPDCTATHEYTEDLEGVFDLWIHHDPTCPQLRAAEA